MRQSPAEAPLLGDDELRLGSTFRLPAYAGPPAQAVPTATPTSVA